MRIKIFSVYTKIYMIMKTHELRLQITCIAMHRNFITERITRADSGEFTNNNDGIN